MVNSVNVSHFPGKLFVELDIDAVSVRFQIDTGAFSNVIRGNDLQRENQGKMRSTWQRLSLYNDATILPIGLYATEVNNPKTG